MFTLVNSAETVYGFVYVFWLEGGGGTLFKDFPFFPPPPCLPPYLTYFWCPLILSFFIAWLKRERARERERERDINHTFYIFLNKPVCVLLLSIINCYSLQRSSLANLFLNEKEKTLSRGDPRIVSLKWTKYTLFLRS